ncbi:major capsid protein [Bifidobacterium magnum]|uniref:Phage major capsid protein E n=1 Tax=Bifidobacterium magnum TaxID=1692 RepID=A0A087B688_9BIFI|nr:major capsid protein [Bifidobacterium magnum]KFI66538.1 Phage major capsid protein E [Bifidobacterium magnum]
MSGTLVKDIMNPAEATGIVQAGFDFVNGLLPMSKVFPVVSNEGKEVVNWHSVVPVKPMETMVFRAWDAEAGHMDTEVTSGEQYMDLLPLSKMSHITEKDVIAHNDDPKWVRDKAEGLFEKLGQQAAMRIELARVAALMDAKITLEKENGLQVQYTFDRPEDLSAITPKKKWNAAGATPVTDIETWIKLIVNNRGRRPAAVLTTSKVIDALRTNEEMITTYTQRALTDSMPKLTVQQVMEVLAGIGVYDVRMIDEMYQEIETNNGFSVPLDMSTAIPDGTFVMFPAYMDTDLGFTASGPTAEAASGDYGINKSVNDGMVGAMLRHDAPVSYDLWANGTMMPVLQEAVSTAKASVL